GRHDHSEHTGLALVRIRRETLVEKAEVQSPKSELQGLGGWLFLLGIDVVTTALGEAMGMVGDADVAPPLRSIGWILVGIHIAVAYLFFAKSPFFPKAWIVTRG